MIKLNYFLKINKYEFKKCLYCIVIELLYLSVNKLYIFIIFFYKVMLFYIKRD